MTWARLSLSITVRAGVRLLLRRLLRFVLAQVASQVAQRRGHRPAPTQPRDGATRAATTERKQTQAGESGSHEFRLAERRLRAQRVHKQSLGEMERKRSYRRDTVVLALPEFGKKKMGKGHGRAQIEARRNGARPCPSDPIAYLQQARGTKTGDRIGYRHWLTLKNPACHRNPQCRISTDARFS